MSSPALEVGAVADAYLIGDAKGGRDWLGLSPCLMLLMMPGRMTYTSAPPWEVSGSSGSLASVNGASSISWGSRSDLRRGGRHGAVGPAGGAGVDAR